jgi:DNA adenine methylase
MSLLRYPGGKQKQVKLISSYFPPTFTEYREPFLGGGSVLLSIDRSILRRGSELHPDLAALWQMCLNCPADLRHACLNLAAPHKKSEELPHPIYNERLRRVYEAVYSSSPKSPLGRAVRYLFLNRTSRGGYVNDTLKRRKCFSNPQGWSASALLKIFEVSEKLQGAQIFNSPYQELLQRPGSDVFCFCDPPYVKDTLLPAGDKLYQFGFSFQDHITLRNELRETPHKWLLSYDDHQFVRTLYKGFNIKEVNWKYSGNSSKNADGSTFRPVGKELLISNY